MKKLAWLLTAVLAFALASCTKKDSSGAPSEKTVHVAIWSGYLPPEVAQDFEKKFGIKIVVSNYSSNEELLAKLQAGATGYDVIVPSDYMVGVMAKQKLLKPLDRAKLPHASRL